MGFDGALRLWDVRERRALGRLGSKGGSFEGLAVSPDGGTIATAGDDGSVELFDVHRRTVRARLSGHRGAVQSVSFSPDGQTLASAGDDGTIRLWDGRDDASLGEPLRGHQGSIWSVTFSPDGRTLASAGADGTVRLWDLRSRKPEARLLLRYTVPLTVAFSPDGRTLASGNVDGTVRLWSVERASLSADLWWVPGQSRRASPSARTGRRSPRRAPMARFASGTSMDTSSLGMPLHGQQGAILSVAFSRDGRTVATGDDDGTVRLWEGILWSDPADLRREVCRLVIGNLTRSEWGELAPGLAYRTTCPT